MDTFVMLRDSWLILDMAGAVFVTGIAVNIAGAVFAMQAMPCALQ